jgi:hypothetical protein
VLPSGRRSSRSAPARRPTRAWERRCQGARNQAEPIVDRRDQRGGVRLLRSSSQPRIASTCADARHTIARSRRRPFLHLDSHCYGSGASRAARFVRRRRTARVEASRAQLTAGVDRPGCSGELRQAGSVSPGTSAAPLDRDHRGRGGHGRRGSRRAAASREPQPNLDVVAVPGEVALDRVRGALGVGVGVDRNTGRTARHYLPRLASCGPRASPGLANRRADHQYDLPARATVLAHVVRLRDLGEREGLRDRERESARTRSARRSRRARRPRGRRPRC